MAVVKRLLWIAVVGAAVLAGLEIPLRWYKPAPPLPDSSEIGWNAKRSPSSLGEAWDASFAANPLAEVNQLVLRGRPFTREAGDKVRVLLVGDSQVEAVAQPFGDMPEVLLEEALNREFKGRRFEVRSIGASGWGQAQQLVALREYYAKFKADYVLLWHTPGNDYWENAFPDRSTSTRMGLLKPTFVLSSSGLAEFDFAPYRNDGQGFLRHFQLYRRAFRIAEAAGLSAGPRLMSEFYRLIPSGEGHQQVSREKCPEAQVDQYTYSVNRDAYGFAPVSIETGEAFLESRGHFSPFLEGMSERDEYLLRITRALIGEIKHLAQRHGSELIVFVSNQSYRNGTHGFVKGSCVGRSGRWYALTDRAERVRKTLGEFRLIELQRQHSDVSFDDVTISPRDRHLNKLGNELAFRELVEALKQKGLMPDAP